MPEHIRLERLELLSLAQLRLGVGPLDGFTAGQSYIGPNDAKGWSTLRKGLLKTLKDIPKAVIAKLEAFDRTQVGNEPPEQAIIVRGW